MSRPKYGKYAGMEVHEKVSDHHKGRFNKWLAVKITSGVGSMQAAYVFCLLSLASLPAVLSQVSPSLKTVFPHWLISVSLIALVAWIAQTFLQLVLLPIIIVGQNVQAEASDARAAKTFSDTEELLDILNLETAGGLKEAVDRIVAAVKEQRDAGT